MNFYDEIRQHIAEEAKDNSKYMQLAAKAPTEKARKLLTDIAHEEQRHKEYLQEILGNLKSSEGENVSAEDEHGAGSDAYSEVNDEDNSTDA